MTRQEDLTLPLPPEVRRFIKTTAGAYKHSPASTHFFGRTLEMDYFADWAHKSIAPDYDWIKPAGRMIVAAPGAGKSTFVGELQKALGNQGIRVINVEPAEIASASRLAEILRAELPLWSGKKIMSILRKWGGKSKDGIDTALNVSLQAYAKKNGIELENLDVSGATAAIGSILAEGLVTTKDILPLLQNSAPNGCILIIDEAQRMNENQYDDEHWKTVIETMGLPEPREKAEIDRANLILVGLSDTPDVVKAMGSSGLVHYGFSPLPSEDVKSMVANAIRVGLERSDWGAVEQRSSLPELADRYVDAMTERYGDWTRHAQAGADALRNLVENFPDGMTAAPWGMRAAFELGDLFKDEVYEQVLTKTNENCEEALVGLVANALALHGNLIGKAQMKNIIDQGLETMCRYLRLTTGEEFRQANEQAIQGMLRSGLIDTTDFLPNKEDRAKKSYYCPIPSLLSYATREPDPEQENILEVTRKTKLKKQKLSRNRKPFRPNWQDRDDDRSDLEPPDSLRNHDDGQG